MDFKNGMLTLELSSYVLEISNDAFATLNHFLIGFQHSVEGTASWLVDVGK